MNDHHLDDLIIGDPEPGNKNPKTLLTIIALLVVVLIIGLILWALLFSPPAQTEDQSAEETQEMPLDPTLIPIDQPAQTTSTPKKKAQETPKPKQTPKPKPKPKATPKPKPVQKPIAEEPAKPTMQPQAPVETKKQQPKGAQLIKNANKTIYYIQVGAFKRNPSKKFIQKLKDGGFTFITKISKGIRRVRVGPYDSLQEAKAALPDIKAKIGVDGLVVKF